MMDDGGIARQNVVATLSFLLYRGVDKSIISSLNRDHGDSIAGARPIIPAKRIAVSLEFSPLTSGIEIIEREILSLKT